MPDSTRARYVPTSHEDISHKDVDNLGYDWALAGDRELAPQRPLAVFFPRTTEEMAALVGRHHREGTPFRVRGRGHSSNDLVLGDRGVSIICTEYMNDIGRPDGETLTVRVQAGAVTAEIDAVLAGSGFGLPVIGDHNHITAAGFAAVGGVSPASHRSGLFIDNIVEIECVQPDGTVVTCRAGDPLFDRLRAGTGRHGVITSLVLRILDIDKPRTVLHHERRLTTDAERFLDWTEAMVEDPEDAVMERAMWVELPTPFATHLCIGVVSRYLETRPAGWKRAWDRGSHALLHAIGWLAGRMPRWLDRLLQYAGMIGLIWGPRYASIKNVEAFADRIIDSSVGDPTRMLIVFPPAESYRVVTAALRTLCHRYRQQRALTFICMYVKGIDSPYLARAAGDPQRKFSEIVLYLGVDSRRLRPLLDKLVLEIDTLCAQHGAFRYMHTKTVPPGHALRARIDANEALAARDASSSGASSGVTV